MNPVPPVTKTLMAREPTRALNPGRRTGDNMDEVGGKTLIAALSVLVGALLGSGWVLVAGSYLVFFWSVTGRTPGMYVMNVRVRDKAGKPPSIARALVRVVATWISIVPLFLGYVTVLFDGRRRGLPDIVAGTEVVYIDKG